jgi:hypothetical protein
MEIDVHKIIQFWESGFGAISVVCTTMAKLLSYIIPYLDSRAELTKSHFARTRSFSGKFHDLWEPIDNYSHKK